MYKKKISGNYFCSSKAATLFLMLSRQPTVVPNYGKVEEKIIRILKKKIHLQAMLPSLVVPKSVTSVDQRLAADEHYWPLATLFDALSSLFLRTFIGVVSVIFG